jgi:hypothetical protein
LYPEILNQLLDQFHGHLIPNNAVVFLSISTDNPGLLYDSQLIKNKSKNITITDFNIGLNVLHGNFAKNQIKKTKISKNACPNKPVGKNTVMMIKTKLIIFKEGLRR